MNKDILKIARQSRIPDMERELQKTIYEQKIMTSGFASSMQIDAEDREPFQIMAEMLLFGSASLGTIAYLSAGISNIMPALCQEFECEKSGTENPTPVTHAQIRNTCLLLFFLEARQSRASDSDDLQADADFRTDASADETARNDLAAKAWISASGSVTCLGYPQEIPAFTACENGWFTDFLQNRLQELYRQLHSTKLAEELAFFLDEYQDLLAPSYDSHSSLVRMMQSVQQAGAAAAVSRRQLLEYAFISAAALLDDLNAAIRHRTCAGGALRILTLKKSDTAHAVLFPYTAPVILPAAVLPSLLTALSLTELYGAESVTDSICVKISHSLVSAASMLMQVPAAMQLLQRPASGETSSDDTLLTDAEAELSFAATHTRRRLPLAHLLGRTKCFSSLIYTEEDSLLKLPPYETLSADGCHLGIRMINNRYAKAGNNCLSAILSSLARYLSSALPQSADAATDTFNCAIDRGGLLYPAAITQETIDTNDAEIAELLRRRESADTVNIEWALYQRVCWQLYAREDEASRKKHWYFKLSQCLTGCYNDSFPFLFSKRFGGDLPADRTALLRDDILNYLLKLVAITELPADRRETSFPIL